MSDFKIRTMAGIFSALALTLGFVPTGHGQEMSQGLPTQNIGSAEWWAKVPNQEPNRKRQGNRIILSCTKGFQYTVAGVMKTKTTASGTSTSLKVDPRKKMKVAWVGGGQKTVRQGTPLCRKAVGPLRPNSPAELSTWTFAPESRLANPIGVVQPPTATCQPAIAPTSESPTVLSYDLVSSANSISREVDQEIVTTSKRGPESLTGMWTVRWRLLGGSGLLRYDTRVRDKNGIYQMQKRVVELEPAGTDADITMMMGGGNFGGTMVIDHYSVSAIDPNCGQQYLPSWLQGGWYGGQTANAVLYDMAFYVVGSKDDPEILRLSF